MSSAKISCTMDDIEVNLKTVDEQIVGLKKFEANIPEELKNPEIIEQIRTAVDLCLEMRVKLEKLKITEIG
jgi:hypothetical protein